MLLDVVIPVEAGIQSFHADGAEGGTSGFPPSRE
jgi:hypothetical protein